jgi:hypothetical protein
MTQIQTSLTPSAGSSRTAADLAPIVVTPEDSRYPHLTVGNNNRWTAQPDSVWLPRSTEEVVAAVQYAVDNNLRLSVKGGGHSYCDFVYNSDVRVIIDTSALNSVGYNDALGAFEIEPGATLLNVYQVLYKEWGVTIPGGMCYSVGAGGHIAGGGYGILSRRHGLTTDHLYAVEVVTVDSSGIAHVVLATSEADDPNRDLWWAHTGGGGGNMGVVTRYFFRTPGTEGLDPSQQLVSPPKEAFVSELELPWTALTSEVFAEMVGAFGEWHAQNATGDSPGADLCSFLVMMHKSSGGIGLLTQSDATVPGAERILHDYLKAVTGPLGSNFTLPTSAQRMPWLTATKLLGTSMPMLTSPVLRGMHKSAYLNKPFSDEQVTALYQGLTQADHANPMSMVVLLSYGGQINAVPSAATSSAQRSSIFKGLFQSLWSGADQDAANIAWVRNVFSEVFASSGGYPVPSDAVDGCFINYPDMDIADSSQNKSGVPWYTLYYKDNYPELQRIKAAYDPSNTFRHRQSITLPD